MQTKDVIFQLRIKFGLSQDKLAEKLFVTRQAVSRWETGETLPSLDMLKALSKLFDQPVDVLLGLPDKKIYQSLKEEDRKMANLKNWLWIHYEHEIMVDWEQAHTEGKMVDDLRPICEYIEKNAKKQDLSDLGKEICKKLADAPMDPAFPYEEPSEWDEILAQRPAQTFKKQIVSDDDVLREKLTGAWIGRIAGCLLGKPVEGFRTPKLYDVLKSTKNWPMHRYIDSSEFSSELIERWELDPKSCWINNVHGPSPVDDDTNYTTLGLRLVEVYGKNFTPEDVMEAWLRWLPLAAVCTAERVAYRNAAQGLLPPQTATYQNAFREYIGAQIRADFFGYVNPGDPEAAAKMGFKDASISHVKNGIYGEMWVAAMIAVAAVCEDMEKIICAGLEQIPANCRLQADVSAVLDGWRAGWTEEQSRAAIQAKFNENTAFGWCYTNSNAAIVAHALLYGKKDFGKTICLAVQCGFDTDCNGATVGSILGMVIGGQAIPDSWWKPFGKRLCTSIDGYPVVSVEDMVEKSLELIHREN